MDSRVKACEETHWRVTGGAKHWKLFITKDCLWDLDSRWGILVPGGSNDGLPIVCPVALRTHARTEMLTHIQTRQQTRPRRCRLRATTAATMPMTTQAVTIPRVATMRGRALRARATRGPRPLPSYTTQTTLLWAIARAARTQREETCITGRGHGTRRTLSRQQRRISFSLVSSTPTRRTRRTARSWLRMWARTARTIRTRRSTRGATLSNQQRRTSSLRASWGAVNGDY
jgi:hypothetical protein